MTTEHLIILQKSYDFEKQMYGYLKKFPQSEKFALTTEIKNTIYSFNKKIIKATKVEKKKSILYEADVELAHLRHLLRLSYDLKYMSKKGYEVSSLFTTEIGKMLGKWISNIK